jgi:ABC-type antimicrobial peptide transport system permease subunit
VSGDRETALNEPFSIFVTEKMSRKFFDEENPIGKVIRINNRQDFLVTGVLKDVPSNSHLRFDFLIPFTVLKEFHPGIEGWGFFRCNSYVQLEKGASYQELSKKIINFLNEKIQIESRPELSLVPLSRYFIYEEFFGIAIKLVFLFSLIAILIWISACINFINLSTARSFKRSKEVGVRKVLGANRLQLAHQFIAESIIISFISLVFALMIVEIALPGFRNLTDLDISLDYIGYDHLSGLLAITITTGLLSGIYPALYLSAFKPVKVLKGVIVSGKKKAFFRKSLVVAQFSITIVLILSTIFLFKQLDLVRHKDLGFDKENVVYIPMKSAAIQENSENAKRDLLQHRDIINVTMSHNMPGFIVGSGWYWHWPGQDPNSAVTVFETSVDYDFVETLTLQMAGGRFFSEDFPADLSGSVVVNETAVKVMGLESPIGQKITRFSREYTIIGVVKDFHHLPILSEIKPLTLRFRSDENRHMFVKIKPEDVSHTISYIEEVFARYNPAYPFEYKFLIEEADILETYMRPLGKIIFLFTFLAIFISCLGLFGLVSYMAENCTKEIGIRKVFGASVAGIVYALSREFTNCVLIANLIALPPGYLLVRFLLENFAYRTDIEFLIFMATGLLTLAIALTTVSYQAIKAAIANPVESLRYE